MSLPMLPPQAVLLRQRRLQDCGLRPGDVVLVPRAGMPGSRRCYVCVAWPDDTPEFGAAPLTPTERGSGCDPIPSTLGGSCTPVATNSFDPCVMVSEAQVAAACTSMDGLLCLPFANRCPSPASEVELQLGRMLRSLVLCHGASITVDAPLPQQPDATIVLAVKKTLPPTDAVRLLRITSHTRVRIANKVARQASETSVDDRMPMALDSARSSLVDQPRVGGLAAEMQSLRELLTMHPIWPSRLPYPSGVLLHGPSGTGKTTLVRSVAAQAGAIFAYIHGPELHSPYPGEAERALRRKFRGLEEHLVSVGQQDSSRFPVGMLFIDEIDALCPKRSDGSSASASANPEARLVATLLTLMDGVDKKASSAASHYRVVVVAATNRPNAVDPALRRPGRFDREVYVSAPSTEARLDILRVLTERLNLSEDARDEMQRMARTCVGYVGADFGAICREAALLALHGHQRTSVQDFCDRQDSGFISTPTVTRSHLQAALHSVHPASQRTMWSTEVPRTMWSDIGGLASVKARLQRYIEWPCRYPEMFKTLGIPPLRGIMLHGPPGCSKTTLVRAVATASTATFITATPAQIMSSFVGDAERTVRQIFDQARRTAPAVVFFDEIDALVSARSETGDSSGGVQQRMLAALLNEMDGIDRVAGVLVVAATNRIDMIDSALLRPGRFDEILHVKTPKTLDDHAQIFKVHTSRMPLSSDVDVHELAKQVRMAWTVKIGANGADIGSICREAAMHSLRDAKDLSEHEEFHLAIDHFHRAMLSHTA